MTMSERITFPKRDYCKSCQGFTCFDNENCFICKNKHSDIPKPLTKFGERN